MVEESRKLQIYGRFAEMVRTRRKELGIRQGELAEWVGVTRATISCVETAKTGCSLHVAIAISQALGIDMAFRCDGKTLPKDELLIVRKRRKIAALRAEIERMEASVATL